MYSDFFEKRARAFMPKSFFSISGMILESKMETEIKDGDFPFLEIDLNTQSMGIYRTGEILSSKMAFETRDDDLRSGW